MEQSELIDFLYIDKDKIFNYYAQFAEGLKNMFFPKNAHILTPIVIYRKIK